MPHPEQEHALMIEVATLTRQRDDMERIGNAKIAKWQSRAEAAESERDALRGEVKRLREALKRLADAAELFASSDTDMPSHEQTEMDFEAQLTEARETIA